MKLRSLLCIILIFLIAPLIAQAQGAQWTIIYYSAADNDLESFMIGDVLEMQLIGSTDEVNIVLQMDRAEGYDAVNGDWTDTRRFFVTAAQGATSSGDFQISQEAFIENLRTIDPAEFGATQEDLDAEIAAFQELPPSEFEQVILGLAAPPGGNLAPVGLQLESLENLGETNSGDPADLVDFALWAIQNYPAENYMLIISNHGGGWTTIAVDEGSEGDGLTMPELDQALAEIVGQSGIGKFDLVAFDACLMAQIEVFQVLAPYAEYTIASQEVIPGAGWEYVTPLQALVNNPQMSMEEFGKQVVDGYMNYYTNVLTDYNNFDLHLIDLSQVENVVGALDQFATAVQSNPDENLKPIGNARNNAQFFSSDDPNGADLFSSVDIADFMNVLMKLTSDESVRTAAQQVIDAVDQMEVYGQSSPGLPGSNGVAIYFPANSRIYELGENNQKYSQQVSQNLSGWMRFLDVFHGTAEATFLPDELLIEITDVLPSGEVTSIWDPPVVLFNTNGSGIIDLQFYAALMLEDGSQIILDQSPLVFTIYTADGEPINEFPEGFSENEFTWNVEMPLVSDGANSVETLLFSEQDGSQFIVNGIYHWGNGDTADSYIVFDSETQQSVSYWGTQESSDGGQATAEIKPQRGDTFEPYWLFLNQEGEVEYIPSGVQLVFGDDPFTYSYIPAVDGSYELTMWVEDMAGNVSVASSSFTVSNEDLDTNYRGFKDTSLGINFLYPWGWADPAVIEDEEGGITLQSSDPTGEILIFVEGYYVETFEDIVQIANDNLASYGATVEPADPFEITGYAAQTLFYGYVSDTGDRAGAQLVIYVPENGLGYIIDIDSSAELFDSAYETLLDVVDSVVFFPPLETTGE